MAIYDVGRARSPPGAADGRAVQFVAMELVSGATLREAIDKRTGSSSSEMLEYLTQAAEALAAAHAAGIVHGNLKPENLMVADGGYVKVLDFGLAKLRGDGGDAARPVPRPSPSEPAPSPGIVMGTVGYMSPEQAQGRLVDQRSDIFSFGCILYEAAAGSRALLRDSVVDTLHRIIHGDQPEPITVKLPSAHAADLQRILQQVPGPRSRRALSVDEGGGDRSARPAQAARKRIGGRNRGACRPGRAAWRAARWCRRWRSPPSPS